MKLYLMRHGDYIAEVFQQGGQLSNKGQRVVTKIAQFIAPLHISVTTLFHSSKLRAQETAALIKDSIHATQGMQLHPHINPNDDINLFIDEVIAADQSIFIVSHLPFLANVVSSLLINKPEHEIVLFEPGTLVALSQIEEKRFAIDWVLSPNLFLTG